MSYCLNPTCQNAQNPGDAEFCQSCGSNLLLTFDQNSPSASRYRTIKPIGQGGFGRTFLAVDESKPVIFSQCVIKQFLPQNTAAEKAAQLFHQEAAQLETLGKHPQIPELLAHFEQNGRQYLVQEFIDGKNLAQELEQKGAFTETQIRQLLNDLLPVLHFVHKSKVIHRDIKPENIIRRRLSPTPIPALENSFQPSPFQKNIVLVDFGAAKKVTNGLQRTGTIIGSAAYIAPEQLMGKAVFASDIYSLGVTCIHLLTQIPPFDLFDSTEDSWAWRNYLKTAVSDDFGRILDTMLQSATNRRYSAASAVIRQLNPKPVYLEAKPVIDAPETPAKQVSALPAVAPLFTQEQQAEIQQTLQDAIAPYNVTIQLNQAKQKLNIVINRTADNPVYYPHLSQIISTRLTDLQLNKITAVKLLGRVNNSRVPEWKEVLQIDSKIKLRNKLVRLHHDRLLKKIAPLTTTAFWLPKLRTRDFWIDSLMFALVWFIFGSQIVIFNAWFALIIASAFMVVKYQVSQNKEFANNNLFASLVVLFLIAGGMGNSRILNTGIFGILLGCLVVALPLFFVKENYQ